MMGGNLTTSRGGREPEAAACQEVKVDDEARIGAGDDDIHHPKQQSTSNRGEQMQMDVCALRGKGEGGDRGTVDNNDDEAIGGDDVCRLKQQSTNIGGEKKLWMAVCVMRGGGVTRGGGGREAAKPPEAEASAVKRPAVEQEPEASGISG